jgi:hypothetical protein
MSTNLLAGAPANLLLATSAEIQGITALMNGLSLFPRGE